MDKYIGFDIDSNKTVACVVQKGQKDRFTTLAVARKLLSIMRAMQMTGELFNEELVCRECGFINVKKSA